MPHTQNTRAFHVLIVEIYWKLNLIIRMGVVVADRTTDIEKNGKRCQEMEWKWLRFKLIFGVAQSKPLDEYSRIFDHLFIIISVIISKSVLFDVFRFLTIPFHSILFRFRCHFVVSLFEVNLREFILSNNKTEKST